MIFPTIHSLQPLITDILDMTPCLITCILLKPDISFQEDHLEYSLTIVLVLREGRPLASQVCLASLILGNISSRTTSVVERHQHVRAVTIQICYHYRIRPNLQRINFKSCGSFTQTTLPWLAYPTGLSLVEAGRRNLVPIIDVHHWVILVM
jgi:hypothetical protein